MGGILRNALVGMCVVTCVLLSSCGGGSSKQNPQPAGSASPAADPQQEQEFVDRAKTDAGKWYSADTVALVRLHMAESEVVMGGTLHLTALNRIRKQREAVNKWKGASSPSERFQSSFDLWMVVVADQEAFLSAVEDLPKTLDSRNLDAYRRKLEHMQGIVDKMSDDFDAYSASLL